MIPMTDFLIHLVFTSFLLSCVFAIWMRIVPHLQKKCTAQTCYFAGLSVLIGFFMPLLPVRFSLNGSKAQDIVYTDTAGYIEAAPKHNSIIEILFLIWLGGAILYLCIPLIRHFRFMRHTRKYAVPAAHDTQLTANKLAREMSVPAPEEVRILPVSISPMMTGLLTPIILLPADKMTKETQYYILKHEMMHFKRKDLWGKILFLLCRAIHWFNPFMSVIGQALDQACELACDASVIKTENAHGRKQYCRTILTAAELQIQKSAPAISTAFCSNKERLQKRMEAVLTASSKHMQPLLAVFAVVLVTVMGSLTVFAEEDTISDYNTYKQNSPSTVTTTTVTVYTDTDNADAVLQTTIHSPTTTVLYD